MIRWFRRKRPTPPLVDARLSLPDALAASHAGLNYWQWMALTNPERAELRWRVKL